METIQRLENPMTKFQPSIEKLDAYLDLFHRLCLILEKADEIKPEEWTEQWCQEILCDLKHEFARIKMPKRTTIWQMLLVEQCLQPLWNRITVDDLRDIKHEFSRRMEFSKRVTDIGYVIQYWQHLLQCQHVVLEREKRDEYVDVKVHMTAFGQPGDIRIVHIPSVSLEERDLFELIYHYGQNEVQDQNYPSVSVGDVAELINGELWICGLGGWCQITRSVFEAYKKEAYPGSDPEPSFIAMLHPLITNSGEDEVSGQSQLSSDQKEFGRLLKQQLS